MDVSPFGLVFRKKLWDIYETIFKVGDKFYKGIVNIINNKKERLLKDVTKIEDITKAIVDSYGKNPKFAFLRDVSMGDNVTFEPENASGENGNVRFFVKDGEDRTTGEPVAGSRTDRTYSADAQGEERTGNGLERTQTDSAVRFDARDESPNMSFEVF